MAIVKQYKVTISKDAQATTDYIYVYQHDRGVDLQFSIIDMRELGNGFRGDILKGLSDMYSTITIVKPDSSSFKSEKLPIVSGKVLFTITEELTDELTEIGMYTLQIHLHDIQDNRITIPEVQFEVKELISDLDCENTGAVAGYSRVGMTEVASEQVLFTFTRGYGKTTWATGDKITAVKLNNLETGLETVTAEVEQLKASGGGTGTQGPKGDKGDTGATPNISIGSVVTLAPGQNATVTKTGTAEAPVLNFAIPKGDKGDTGTGGSGGTDPDPNSHTHANKTVLDGITEQKVAEWDNKNGGIVDGALGPSKLDKEFFNYIFGVSQNTNIYGDIVLSTEYLSVNENSTNSFTIKLDKSPSNNQDINIVTNNEYCTVSKKLLTFTPSNYNIAQTITISGLYDNYHYSDKNSIITISSENVRSKNISVTIKNIDEQPGIVIPVQSITLNKTTHAMIIGETFKLAPTISPIDSSNKEVTWEASNSNCIVIDGLVTAKAKGECVITCTTVNGNKTDNCTVIIQSNQEVGTTNVDITMNIRSTTTGATDNFSYLMLLFDLSSITDIIGNNERFNFSCELSGEINGVTDFGYKIFNNNNLQDVSNITGGQIVEDLKGMFIDNPINGQKFNIDCTSDYVKTNKSVRFAISFKTNNGGFFNGTLKNCKFTLNGRDLWGYYKTNDGGKFTTILSGLNIKPVANVFSLFKNRSIVYPYGNKIIHQSDFMYLDEFVSNWKGKIYMPIGDSITDKTERSTINYWDYISEWTGCIVKEEGWNGFTMVQLVDKINNFSINVDIISVFAGTNDFNHGGEELGTFGDKTKATFAGSVYLMAKGLIEKYPTKTVLFFTPLPRRDFYGYITCNVNARGHKLCNYVDIIKQTCNEFSIPCLDLYTKSGLYPWISDNNKEYFSSPSSPNGDGLHPNEKGHKIIAKKILSFINDYIR